MSEMKQPARLLGQIGEALAQRADSVFMAHKGHPLPGAASMELSALLMALAASDQANSLRRIADALEEANANAK